MNSVQELFNQLTQSLTFKDYNNDHSNAYLSHFFCAITSNLELKSIWEIGFYQSETKKISIFVKSESTFILKQEDDVFKKETTKVEKLELDKVKTNYENVSKICKDKLSELFPKEIMGDGFVVLQTFENKTQWNFTFVTKTLKFANVKVDATSSKINSYQLVEAVQREK